MMIATVILAAAEEGQSTQSPVIPALYDIVWGTICFVIVLAFFIWKVVPSMNKMLDARKDAIEGGIKRAD